MNVMASSTSTKLGHHAVDFPDIWPPLSADVNSIIDPVPVIFLFKIPEARREEILQQLAQGDDTPWDEDVPRRALGGVAWLRSFTLSIDDVRHIASGTCCITIDEPLLKQGKCIISHILPHTVHPLNNDTREFAIVDINAAYQLACATTEQTWFPTTLPHELEFTPPRTSLSEPYEARDDAHDRLPVFITVPLTPSQETYLSHLLTRGDLTPLLFHVPNSNPSTPTIQHLTHHFLTQHWLPADFAIIDALTVSSLPDPIPSTLPTPSPPSAPENRKRFGSWGDNGGAWPAPLVSLGLATQLYVLHRDTEGCPMAMDLVGYALGRMPLYSHDVYENWCYTLLRRAGLGGFIGVGCMEGKEGDGEEVERWYWDCWVGEDGEVEEEIKGRGEVQW